MNLGEDEEHIARVVIGSAMERNLGRHAAVAAVCVIYAECSGLVLYANDGTSTLLDAALKRQLNEAERAVARQSMDFPHKAIGRDLDSMGLFQQRPMSGWGEPGELMDPAISAGKFYDGAGHNPGLVAIADWQALEPWDAGRRVQQSLIEHAGLYQEAQPLAVEIVDALWDSTTPNNGKAEDIMATRDELKADIQDALKQALKPLFDDVEELKARVRGGDPNLDILQRLIQQADAHSQSLQAIAGIAKETSDRVRGADPNVDSFQALEMNLQVIREKVSA